MDLRTFQKQYNEIILLDGETIHIGKPSQALIIKLLDMNRRIEELSNDTSKVVDILNDIALDILNNNKENRIFDIDYITNNFDFEMEQAFIQDYTEFVSKVQNNPN